MNNYNFLNNKISNRNRKITMDSKKLDRSNRTRGLILLLAEENGQKRGP